MEGMTEVLNRKITDSGFDQFRLGTFGNAGHNLYVSKQGIIQRIHHFDMNGDGYVDLPFVNSHDDETRVPAYLYVNPLENGERIELPTDGAYAAAVGDLTNNGFDDVVIANQYDGVSNEVYAQIYYGSEEGLSSKYRLQLWAPACKDVEIGDFNGDGRKDIAFISREQLRIFYQDEHGFKANGFVDIPLSHDLDSLAAQDLDGDGYEELVIRSKDNSVRVYWGGPDGIQADRHTRIDPELTGSGSIEAGIDQAASGAGAGTLTVYAVPEALRLKIVALQNRPHLFLGQEDKALFLSCGADRTLKCVLALESGSCISAAVGDINGNGYEDIVIASRQADESGGQFSWIYWGSESGYSNERRTKVATTSVNDVKLGDLSGSGCSDVVFCQDKTERMYSFESLIYKGTAGGIDPEPVRLPTHCAMDVFIMRAPAQDRSQVLFINHLSNRILGDVPTYFYTGGPDGFKADRRTELPSWAATEVKMADFNDNGYPDIFIANCNENAMHLERGSYIYYGGTDGYTEDRRIELPTRFNMSGCVADLNQDGYLDLVTVGHNNDELLIFYGSEDGFASEPTRIKLEFPGFHMTQPRYMTLGDFNRNGWLDIVVPDCGNSGRTLILWGGPDGYSNDRFTALLSGPTVSSRAADLNGNGWLDLVVGGTTGDDPGDPYRTFVYIYWGGPEGFSNARRTQLPANFAVDMTIADFNNDGILDIFVACYHGLRTRDLNSYLYWGKEGGYYSADNCTRLFHHSASGALAADFNEDGYIDLAVTNHKTYGNHPGQSYVWWNGPEGFSERNRTSLPTLGPHGITHSDIGNLMDRGPEEIYESRYIRIPDGEVVTGIAWTGEIPHKTWVKAQLRTADQQEALQSASWMGPDGEGTWFEQSGDSLQQPCSGRWLQYRLVLGAVNDCGTPRISRVDIAL
ncbi:FG-GAP-like repeat-containing protein [Paenibacillus eucommiae]|uniref:VCBS repeat-containing protein n=1 Tax=Paenibacillus eucommiae TaxID=1355755 RepID=A0ABS4IM21_9BACL|nr:FG-GAP-like repeat-containing protein [Paenibacillus eucommiae]MBP1988565.1 hypothetical protein [Paenibacillus eucommiae]